MSYILKTTAIALGVIFVAPPAFAEITVDDTWNNLVAYADIYGAALSGTQDRSADTLTITDMTLILSRDGGSGASVALGDVSLVGRDDGSVSLIYPDRQTIILTEFGPEADETITAQMNRTGFVMTASGTPGSVTYDTTATMLEFQLLGVEATTRPDQDFSVLFRSNGLHASTLVSTQSGARVINTTDHDSFALDAHAKANADEFIDFTVTATKATTGYTTQHAGTGAVWSNFVSALKNGLGVGITLEADQYQIDMTQKEAGEDLFEMTVHTENLNSSYSVDKEAVAYRSSAENIRIPFPTTPEFPTPLVVTIDDAMTEILFPTLADDALQVTRFTGRVNNLALNPEFWDLVDPASILPHTPARLDWDTTYQIKMDVGLFGGLKPSTPPTESEPSLTVEHVEINDLRVSALGAELTGHGAVSLDNSDLDTFFGLPAPKGTTQFKIAGVYALIDKLIELGILPSAEASEVRAGLAMLTVTTDTEDTLTSDIEFGGADGPLLVNGMRIK